MQNQLRVGILTKSKTIAMIIIALCTQIGILGCVVMYTANMRKTGLTFGIVSLLGALFLGRYFEKMITRSPNPIELMELAQQDVNSIKKSINARKEWMVVEYSFKALSIKRKLAVYGIYGLAILAIVIGIFSFYELVPPMLIKNQTNESISHVSRWMDALFCFGGATILYIIARFLLFTGFEDMWDRALKQLIKEESAKPFTDTDF